MKHKHRDLIIAWANGAEIQVYFELKNIWLDVKSPSWDIDEEYRIKPMSAPNFVELTSLYQPDGYEWKHLGQFRVTFDGDTKKVLSIEVIK